jgi:hypothetical protein
MVKEWPSWISSTPLYLNLFKVLEKLLWWKAKPLFPFGITIMFRNDMCLMFNICKGMIFSLYSQIT